ncbi:hypothetical protein QTN25_008248 [Entamoeba marina]
MGNNQSNSSAVSLKGKNFKGETIAMNHKQLQKVGRHNLPKVLTKLKLSHKRSSNDAFTKLESESISKVYDSKLQSQQKSSLQTVTKETLSFPNKHSHYSFSKYECFSQDYVSEEYSSPQVNFEIKTSSKINTNDLQQSFSIMQLASLTHKNSYNVLYDSSIDGLSSRVLNSKVVMKKNVIAFWILSDGSVFIHNSLKDQYNVSSCVINPLIKHSLSKSTKLDQFLAIEWY